MKVKMRLGFSFLLIAISISAGTANADCEFDVPDGLLEGKPIVKVSPVYPRKQQLRATEGCVVLGYSLAYGPRGDEGGTYVSNVQVLHSSPKRAKPFEKASKKAIQKWVFSPKTHPPSEEQTHYSIIPFELTE